MNAQSWVVLAGIPGAQRPQSVIGSVNKYLRKDNNLEMGVRGVWVIDPETRKGWDCSSGNWIETGVFRLADWRFI